MPEEYELNPDLTAVALTTLFGSAYDEIHFNMTLAETTHRTVSRLCGAATSGPTSDSTPVMNPIRESVALNFSGGFDSLAARALLPVDIKLISLDFGGAFSRERDFFSRFHPTVIPTNLRSLGYAKNSWSFMGIGPILLRDHLGIGTYSFGSILEATAYNFIDRQPFANTPNPWFAAAGLRQLHPALGLTEVGTAMLLIGRHPESIGDSLTSLAAADSEKAHRKSMMVHLAGRLHGLNFPIAGPTRGTAYQAFGSSFTTDFLVFYVLNRLGPSFAERLVSDIPAEVVSLSRELSLTFFERMNTNFYNSTPTQARALLAERCFESGIGLYDENDWHEFAQVRKLLSVYHPIPASTRAAGV